MLTGLFVVWVSLARHINSALSSVFLMIIGIAIGILGKKIPTI